MRAFVFSQLSEDKLKFRKKLTLGKNTVHVDEIVGIGRFILEKCAVNELDHRIECWDILELCLSHPQIFQEQES